MEIISVLIIVFLVIYSFINRHSYFEKTDKPLYRHRPVHHSCNYDDEDEENKENLTTNDNDSNENYDKHEFYGGISVGNDSVYMTDDDDFLDEFGDDILLKQHP